MRKWIQIVVMVALPVMMLAQRAPQTLRVDVDLVSVNVRVTDTQGRTVIGLEPKDFEIFEDRVAQKIENFSIEEIPASIGIILDISGSMAPVIEGARRAALDLLRIGTAHDEFFLITFNNRPRIEQTFTRDTKKIEEKLMFGGVQGSTALWDAMYLGVETVKKGTNPRKALVSITDGDNNRSRYSGRDFAELMREQDVQIFYIDTDVAKKLDAEKVATSLKTQYLIGYRSTNESRDGKWRDILVRVKTPPGMPRLIAKSRDGYYAPTR